MIILNLGMFNGDYGTGLNPHLGLSFAAGLLLGPYGALGAVIGNTLCDIIRGYHWTIIIFSEITTFGVSCLAYKLWYNEYRFRDKVTPPKLDGTNNILVFIGIILLTGALYSLVTQEILYLRFLKHHIDFGIIGIEYFINYINSAFILGIIGIWTSDKIDFIYIPKTSDKQYNKKFYTILAFILIIIPFIFITSDHARISPTVTAAEIAIILIVLFVYLRKPITCKITEPPFTSITEKISKTLILTVLLISLGGIFLISVGGVNIQYFFESKIELPELILIMQVVIDIIILLFAIPSFIIVRYIEKKIVTPIISFSKINDFIKENEKIETEGLLNIYSNYINENNEIGIMAKSYTHLIEHNNEYIENIREIEGEKERIEAELSIATKIQASNLPTSALVGENYMVNGYSHPAKEVGGDFFDYYEIDEDNLAIVIGDASGKGVPAALLATVTQVMIKQILEHEKDPSIVLYNLNNQLCETNTEAMFITLWLGIYNKTSKIITFSNAGHNPPLIVEENNKYHYIKMDSGLVLGVMENYEYISEEINLSKEIVLYTDGITDACNTKNEMYGEERLKIFFNNFKNDKGPIKPLLHDIEEFTDSAPQFDDMTILYLKIEND